LVKEQGLNFFSDVIRKEAKGVTKILFPRFRARWGDSDSWERLVDRASNLRDGLAGAFHKDGGFPAGVFSIIVKDTEYDLGVWDVEPGVDDFGGLVVKELGRVCIMDAWEAFCWRRGELWCV